MKDDKKYKFRRMTKIFSIFSTYTTFLFVEIIKNGVFNFFFQSCVGQFKCSLYELISHTLVY